MSDIETRLRDALSARADLVQPEHLTPTPSPVLDGPPVWWRRPGTLLAVAAVTVLVIAVGLAMLALTLGNGGDRGDGLATNPTDSATPDTDWWEQHPRGLPGAWYESRGVPTGTWVEGDLDGDGEKDRARITGGEGDQSLEVESGVGSSTIPVDGPSAVVEPFSPMGGDTYLIPVAVSEGAAGTTYTTWHVYMYWEDPDPIEVPAPDAPFFGSQTSNLPESDGGRDTWRTWVDPDGNVYTMSYDDEGTLIDDPDYPGAGKYVYRNTFYRWHLGDGLYLEAEKLGQGCTVKGETMIYGCP